MVVLAREEEGEPKGGEKKGRKDGKTMRPASTRYGMGPVLRRKGAGERRTECGERTTRRRSGRGLEGLNEAAVRY